MSLNTPASATSNRRRLLMAAASVVAVIGVTGIALAINNTSSDDDQTPSPAVATVAPTTTVAPAMQTVRFAVTGANIPVTFTVPDDWTLDEGNHTAHQGSGIGEVGLKFDEVANIYADGCQWVRLDPPVGPTVDDLAAAWANVPDYAATAAVDVNVDGYAGKQIEFTVPDYNIGECKGADTPSSPFGRTPTASFPPSWRTAPASTTSSGYSTSTAPAS